MKKLIFSSVVLLFAIGCGDLEESPSPVTSTSHYAGDVLQMERCEGATGPVCVERLESGFVLHIRLAVTVDLAPGDIVTITRLTNGDNQVVHEFIPASSVASTLFVKTDTFDIASPKDVAHTVHSYSVDVWDDSAGHYTAPRVITFTIE